MDRLVNVRLTSTTRSSAALVVGLASLPDGFPIVEDHTLIAVSFPSSDTPTDITHSPPLA